MTAAAVLAGTLAALALVFAVAWSIRFPARRLWPPRSPGAWNKVLVWTPTVIVFAALIWLGASDWNGLGWPAWLRWGVGATLVAASNVVVWWGVAEIGPRATSGDATGLRTGGLYRWSRNPQYAADVAMVVGWAILSASALVLPVAIPALVALLLAPLSEEPWLEARYGEAYRAYRRRVPRFVGIAR